MQRSVLFPREGVSSGDGCVQGVALAGLLVDCTEGEELLQMTLRFTNSVCDSILYQDGDDQKPFLKMSKKCQETSQCFFSELIFLDPATIKGNHVLSPFTLSPTKQQSSQVHLYTINTKSNVSEVHWAFMTLMRFTSKLWPNINSRLLGPLHTVKLGK